MTQAVKARLRIAAAERGHVGGPQSRDACIDLFLGELSTVVCDEVVEAKDPDILTVYYETWVGWVNEGVDEPSRRARLIRSVNLFLPCAPEAAKEEIPDNVVRLR